MLSYISALEEAFLETSDANYIHADFQIKATGILEQLINDIKFAAIREAREESERMIEKAIEVARDRVC